MCSREFIVFILSFFLLVACNKEEKTIKIEFKEKRTLTGEKIEMPVLMDFRHMTLKENRLIITGVSQPHRIHVFSVPDLELVQSFGNTGKGPDEISANPAFCVSPGSEYLYIKGYTSLSIKKFSLNDEGLFETKGTILMPYYELFNYMNIVNDSILFYYAVDEVKIKKYDLINEKYLEGLQLEKENDNVHKRSFNKGMLYTNGSVLIYPYEYKRQIDIYDVETLKLKKRMKGEYKEPTDVNNLIDYYLRCYTGEKYFYVLYQGRKPINSEEDYWLPYTLEVFDYDANPIVEYSFDNSPLDFVVDEKNGYIYAYNHLTYPEHFLRYKL